MRSPHWRTTSFVISSRSFCSSSHCTCNSSSSNTCFPLRVSPSHLIYFNLKVTNARWFLNETENTCSQVGREWFFRLKSVKMLCREKESRAAIFHTHGDHSNIFHHRTTSHDLPLFCSSEEILILILKYYFWWIFAGMCLKIIFLACYRQQRWTTRLWKNNFQMKIRSLSLHRGFDFQLGNFSFKFDIFFNSYDWRQTYWPPSRSWIGLSSLMWWSFITNISFELLKICFRLHSKTFHNFFTSIISPRPRDFRWKIEIFPCKNDKDFHTLQITDFN